MHCIEATIELVSDRELDFGGVREVELGIRVPDLPDVRVEACQARGAARLVAGSVVAAVGERFEVFFRLSGPDDARALLELYHQGGEAEVVPCTVDGRFQVSVLRGTQEVPTGPKDIGRELGWLDSLPEGGVRKLFEHLAAHGAVTEPEAASMLGGPRELRRFANRFEEYAIKAPFGVRIDVIGGVKRYVREGTA
jgi:hypothetical protein